MNLTSPHRRRIASAGALLAGLLAVGASGGGAATATASAPLAPSPGVQACIDDGAASSAARVKDGSTAKEPKLYPDNEAKAYGAVKSAPLLKAGSVEIKTVFHGQDRAGHEEGAARG